MLRQPKAIDSNGTIYGGAEIFEMEEGTIWDTDFISQHGVAARLLPPDPPYGPGEFEPGNGNWVTIEGANDSGYGGVYHGFAQDPSDPTGESYYNVWGGFICGGGSTIETGDLTSEDALLPVMINRVGSAIGGRGFAGGASTFRDGTTQALVDLDQPASALNDQNQIVSATGGWLWENGAKVVLAHHLPTGLVGRIVNIRPFALSNQAAPGTDSTIYLLATAQVDGAAATLVITRDHEGEWSFAQIQQPEGTTVSQYVSINSSGVVASIGDVSQNTQSSGMSASPQSKTGATTSSILSETSVSSSKKCAVISSPVVPQLTFNTTNQWAHDDVAGNSARDPNNRPYVVGQMTNDSNGGQPTKSLPYEYIYKITPNNSNATSSNSAQLDMAIYEQSSVEIAYYQNNIKKFPAPSTAPKTNKGTYNPGLRFSYTNTLPPATPVMYAFDAPSTVIGVVEGNMLHFHWDKFTWQTTLTSFPLFKNLNPASRNKKLKKTHVFNLTCISGNKNGSGPYTWSASY